MIGTVAALGLGLLWTGSAMADPDTPATADQAQQAYLDSEQRAGALNEEVLVAQGNEQAAVAAAAAAGEQVTAAAAAPMPPSSRLPPPTRPRPATRARSTPSPTPVSAAPG